MSNLISDENETINELEARKSMYLVTLTGKKQDNTKITILLML